MSTPPADGPRRVNGAEWPGSRNPGPSVPLLRGPFGPKGGSAGRFQRLAAGLDGLLHGLQGVQPVAPDDDLVAVGQDTPLDALAVDEHAVEAAVVEDAHAVGLAHDQGVPPRDRRVVEADVGGQAAAHPGPLALERRHPDVAGLVPGQVLAGFAEHRASPGDQGLALLGGGLVTGTALEAPAREQRVILPGMCYRNEAISTRSEIQFYQV